VIGPIQHTWRRPAHPGAHRFTRRGGHLTGHTGARRLLISSTSFTGFVLTALVLTLGIGVGTAFAYWNTLGSGAGTGATGSPLVISFSVTGQSPAPLYPGASGNIAIRITNPYSTSAITVSALSGMVTTSNQTACPGASNFTVAASPGGLPIALAAAQTLTPTLTNAVTMSASAANACQGLTVTVTYAVEGRVG
jgi:hypothetical protein